MKEIAGLTSFVFSVERQTVSDTFFRFSEVPCVSCPGLLNKPNHLLLNSGHHIKDSRVQTGEIAHAQRSMNRQKKM